MPLLSLERYYKQCPARDQSTNPLFWSPIHLPLERYQRGRRTEIFKQFLFGRCVAKCVSSNQEEAQELVEATTATDIAWETADLIYFALVKWCVMLMSGQVDGLSCEL
jgi:hypothetical protein